MKIACWLNLICYLYSKFGFLKNPVRVIDIWIGKILIHSTFTWTPLPERKVETCRINICIHQKNAIWNVVNVIY